MPCCGQKLLLTGIAALLLATGTAKAGPAEFRACVSAYVNKLDAKRDPRFRAVSRQLNAYKQGKEARAPDTAWLSVYMLGEWCLNGDLSNSPTFTAPPCDAHQVEVEISATKLNIPPMSCIVRQVTKVDICPYGMIFKNRNQARARRPFQITPGYHIVLQCMNGPAKTLTVNWVMEKDYILDMGRDYMGHNYDTGKETDYRCPWAKKGARSELTK